MNITENNTICCIHTYVCPCKGQMHPLDEALLEEEVAEQPRSKRYVLFVQVRVYVTLR